MYVPEEDELPYVRGRIDVTSAARSPWKVKLDCRFEEHTADVDDNQILAWTLWRIARTGLCSKRVLPTVTQAFRSISSFVTVTGCGSSACNNRAYNRLNNDYRPMHSLCRFFLEHTGPTHEPGEQTTLPFLIDMSSLFELFVAKWLDAHPVEGFVLKSQMRVQIGNNEDLVFKIDLVLIDADSGQAVTVLDTKYKIHESPAADDVAQVVAYAQAKDCRDAVLVYPVARQRSFDVKVGDIRVRSLAFQLDGDLEQNGAWFARQILS